MPEPEPGETPPQETAEVPERAEDAAAGSAALEARFARRRVFLGVFLGIGVIALIAFSVLAYRSFNLRLEAARKLDRATALVEDADRVVVQVDEVVRAEVTSELAERARGALGRVDGAERMLDEAVVLIDEATRDLSEDEQERAALLRQSAVTRQSMLEPAPVILKANAEAAAALPLATQAWKQLVEADRASDRAVSAYNKLTKPGVTRSQQLNKEAAGLLSESRQGFASAEEAFSAAPFEAYLDYIDTRIKLNRISQQSDRAWLARQITKANQLIAQYNRADRRAVAQAKKLPESPEKAVADAYEKAVDEATEEYYRARDAALKADAAVRDY